MTGYVSHAIKENLNAEQFFLHCAKAFLSYYRDASTDAPLPTRKELEDNNSSSHFAELKEQLKEMLAFKKKGKKAMKKWGDNKKKESLIYYKECIKDYNDQNDKVNDLMEKINKIKVPENYNALKEFCINQLKNSLQDISYYQESFDKIDKMDGIAMFNENIEKIQNSIEFYDKENIKTKENIEKTIKWIEGLKEIFPVK